MSAAHKRIGELFGDFKVNTKGAIKFEIGNEPVTTFEEYEGMKNVAMYRLTPIAVVEEEEEEEEEDGAIATTNAPTEGVVVNETAGEGADFANM
jgi:hypothetical protein